jgi:hypothetical protein
MIERSVGTIVHNYIVGGGYQGNTEELDNTVKQMAEVLQTIYSRDIEIRFNTDGNSGGAWLKNSLPGFSGNCQVGLCAGLRIIRPNGMTDDEIFEKRKEWWTWPKELYIATNLKPSVLPISFTCNCKTYDYRYHTSIKEATQYLLDNVDIAKILP